MKLVYLPKDESTLKTVATWLYEEFLQGNPSASIERVCSILSERSGSDRVPLSLVALDKRGTPVGVVSLTASDMKARPDLTPWLSGLYVAPEERGKGIGALLWRAISVELYGGSEVPVMQLLVQKSEP